MFNKIENEYRGNTNVNIAKGEHSPKVQRIYHHANTLVYICISFDKKITHAASKSRGYILAKMLFSPQFCLHYFSGT